MRGRLGIGTEGVVYSHDWFLHFTRKPLALPSKVRSLAGYLDTFTETGSTSASGSGSGGSVTAISPGVRRTVIGSRRSIRSPPAPAARQSAPAAAQSATGYSWSPH